MRRADFQQSGFTLIEVLVALIISAFLLLIIIDGAVNARTRLSHAEQKRAAALTADGLIARAAVSPYRALSQTGTTDDRNWQVTEVIEATDRRGAFALVRIEARVDVPGAPLYIARTRRLMALPPS